MKDGFVKVCAASIDVKVADINYNVQNIINEIQSAYDNDAQIVVFQELAISSCSCQDLFLQSTILNGCIDGLFRIVSSTVGKKMVVVVGLPIKFEGKLYNCAAVINNGEILGFVPKTYIRNDEARYFDEGFFDYREIIIKGEEYLIGSGLLFSYENDSDLTIAVEVGSEAMEMNSPATSSCLCGATVILNPSCDKELAGKTEYRNLIYKAKASMGLCAYVVSMAGKGESTQDFVMGGHKIIIEKDEILSESLPFEGRSIYSEIDYQKLVSDRVKKNTFESLDLEYVYIDFELEEKEVKLTRKVNTHPFIPKDVYMKEARCEEILMIQAQGLMKRIEHVKAKNLIIGLSGGLDSCLAILVMVKAVDLLKMDRKQIIAVSMPCFGTSNRTQSNASLLAEALGVTFKEIDIKEVTSVHLRDLEHDENVHDVTYENAQARERTQILMGLANKYQGFVVGTGDLSELALGWATYNGDHMSMYGVNGTVPKTLVRELVSFVADKTNDKNLSDTLKDIVLTPVSPELLPPTNGAISQVTEDLVGPYELHDFFLYYIVRYGFSPSKVYRLAKYAFENKYDGETILKWLKKFYYRFISQQFKRSCMPDGIKVGTVGLSPRGDFLMSSDSSFDKFIEEIENIKE